MHILKIGGNYFSHFKNGKIRIASTVSGAHIFDTTEEVELVERMLTDRPFTRLKVTLRSDLVEEGDMFRAKYNDGREGIFLCTETNERSDGVRLIIAHDVRLRRPKDCYFVKEEIIESWKKQ